jgi:hypothetical protein
VLIPESSTLQPEQEQTINPGIDSLPPPTVTNLPPEVKTQVSENISISGFKLEAQQMAGGGGGEAEGVYTVPPIPGIVVIPGNIGFLHQYFSALAIVTNGAPGMSGLVVKDLKAKIILPVGEDHVAGTDPLPGDDPLRMAEINGVYVDRTLPVMNGGIDGKIGTSDDVDLLHPAESGQADFTIEGLKEGTHKLDFEITATLEGLPIGPVSLKGKATGYSGRLNEFSLDFFPHRS